MKEKQKRYMVLQGLHVMKEDPKLRVLVVDISPICNFNCMYCYGKEESHEVVCTDLGLRFNDYVKLLNQAKTFGVKTIWLMGAHENTLSPMYLDLLKLINKLGMFSVTFSNGAAFGDDDISQKIFGLSCEEFTKRVVNIESASLILKTDSFIPEIQNKLAGNKKAYIQIKQARINCLKYFSLSKFPRFGLNTVLTNSNYLEVSQILEFSLNNNLVYFCDVVLQSGNARKNYLELNHKQMQHCLFQVQKVLNDFEVDEKAVSFVNCYDQNCILFDNYFFITHCGDVLPCAGFPEKESFLGNVKNDSLEFLWRQKLEIIATYYLLQNCKYCPCKEHLLNKTI